MSSIPRRAALVGVMAVVTLGSLMGAARSFALEPWWHVTSGSRPSHLPPAGEGTVVASVENFGDLRVDGEISPVRIADVLPAGLKAVAIVGAEWFANSATPLTCSLSTLTCTLTNSLAPYQQMEVRVRVKVEAGARTGEMNRVSVSGGGAPASVVERPITVSAEATPFGVENFELSAEGEGGVLTTQAGSHPFQVTGTYVFDQGEEKTGPSGKPVVSLVGVPKDINTLLPPGLIGDPTPVATCTIPQFDHLSVENENAEENDCPANSAVGMAAITFEERLIGYTSITVPLFNLEPAFGEPARFGFAIPIGNTTITLDTAVRSGEDYGVTVSSLNTTEQVGLLKAQVTFWGDPGDSRHNSSRGWSCLSESEKLELHGLCAPSTDRHPPSFLTMPTACNGPLHARAEVNAWNNTGLREMFLPPEPLQSLDGCNQLPFSPEVSADPTTDRASAPTGLDVNVDFHDEGLTSAEGIAQSQLNKTVVELPEGLTINPSAGVGLAGCTPEDYARETIESIPGAGCPNNSKLGSVEIETPLLKQKIHGSIFIAQPYENPFKSLVALYVVAKNPETGIIIKLAGHVEPNLATGRLTTIFENDPPLSFSHFNFHFREGQQAPLISPPLCGSYPTEALLSPWSEPQSILTDSSTFSITKGYDGGACPTGGAPPFNPGIESGLINNNAAAYSPFYLHLSRTDGEQEISGFSTDLPSGLTGNLSGIPFCPEADIEAARHKTGAQEEASPSCPAASQVGHTLVGTGVGAVLAYVPGKLYLGGPFHGALFSLVSVTSAVVGPFDLGTVVLRFGLNIDPTTARVNVTPTSSEPIPTILDGIVTHVRDIRVYVDRHNFTLNPTSCNPLSIASTLNSDRGASSTVTSPFQASNCQALAFKPGFKVSTNGKTSRKNGASLTVKLTYPNTPQGTQANIAKVKVDLPKQLPSRLTTLQKACTAAQFEANPAGCPADSIVGHAKAVTPLIPEPLTGPAYFVSHGGAKFPELIIVLQGYGVTINLHGETFINPAGITSSTFRAVPDQPVGSFELTLPQGTDSALAANGNLCKAKLTMPTIFVAQNGKEMRQTTKITATGCPKQKKAKKAGHKKVSHKRGGKRK